MRLNLQALREWGKVAGQHYNMLRRILEYGR